MLIANGPVAQRLAQGTHNSLVAGSIPAGPTEKRLGLISLSVLLLKLFRKISSRIFSGDLPQVVEFNTPRSMGAAGECSAYDGFKACKTRNSFA